MDVYPNAYPNADSYPVAFAALPTNGTVRSARDDMPLRAPFPIDVTSSPIINVLSDVILAREPAGIVPRKIVKETRELGK